MTENYVDKQRLYESLCEWKIRVDQAEAEGKPKPKLPDYVGYAIMQVSERMGSRPNFRNYTYIDEMIGDGMVAAVKAMNKFDPHRLGKNGEVNPFGFISLCVWRAFISRISSEKNIQKAKIDTMLDPVNEHYSTLDGEEFHDIGDKSEISDFYYGNKVW